jgi:hypothetical protein
VAGCRGPSLERPDADWGVILVTGQKRAKKELANSMFVPITFMSDISDELTQLAGVEMVPSADSDLLAIGSFGV